MQQQLAVHAPQMGALEHLLVMVMVMVISALSLFFSVD